MRKDSLMRWCIFAVCLLAAAMCLSPAAAEAQCVNGQCVAPGFSTPGVFVPAPVYHVPPVVIVHARHAPRPSQQPAPAEEGSSGPDTTVPSPVPDPAFSFCTPQGCFRPVLPACQPVCSPQHYLPPQFCLPPQHCLPPRPCYAPWPVHSAHVRRSVGVGVNVSWGGSHHWR